MALFDLIFLKVIWFSELIANARTQTISFLLFSTSNPRVPCEQIPSIDLRVFKEDPDSGGFGDQNYGNGGSGTNAIDYR